MTNFWSSLRIDLWWKFILLDIHWTSYSFLAAIFILFPDDRTRTIDLKSNIFVSFARKSFQHLPTLLKGRKKNKFNLSVGENKNVRGKRMTVHEASNYRALLTFTSV